MSEIKQVIDKFLDSTTPEWCNIYDALKETFTNDEMIADVESYKDSDKSGKYYNILGLLYQEKNMPLRAVDYFNTAIAYGYVYSYGNIASLYQIYGDETLAEKYYGQYYLLGTNNNIVSSAREYGTFYETTGYPGKAERYYIEAIEKGYTRAVIDLANLYLKINHSQVTKYVNMAVTAGSLSGYDCTEIGRIYADLYNTDKKDEYKVNAVNYFEIAINKNADCAAQHLGEFYESMNCTTLAINYYRIAIDRHSDTDAIYKLGMLYYRSYMSTNNEAVYYYTVKYLTNAVEAGFESAREFLVISYQKHKRNNTKANIDTINDIIEELCEDGINNLLEDKSDRRLLDVYMSNLESVGAIKRYREFVDDTELRIKRSCIEDRRE